MCARVRVCISVSESVYVQVCMWKKAREGRDGGSVREDEETK